MQEFKDFIKSRTPVNLTIVIINILVFVILEIGGDTENSMYMAEHGAFVADWAVYNKEYYRFITCMFLHFGLEHLIGNMLVLIFLGDTLERMVGKIRYLIIYLGGGLCGNILSCYFELQSDMDAVSAGASGAVFAVIGALIFLIVINRGQSEELDGRNLLIMAVLSVFQGITSKGVDNWAHIGGLVGGFLLASLLCFGQQKRKHSTNIWGGSNGN